MSSTLKESGTPTHEGLAMTIPNTDSWDGKDGCRSSRSLPGVDVRHGLFTPLNAAATPRR